MLTCIIIIIILCNKSQKPEPCKGLSTVFINIFNKSGGQLIFTGRQNFLNWTCLFIIRKLSSRWSNQVDKIILTAGQFAQCLALNETPALVIKIKIASCWKVLDWQRSQSQEETIDICISLEISKGTFVHAVQPGSGGGGGYFGNFWVGMCG